MYSQVVTLILLSCVPASGDCPVLPSMTNGDMSCSNHYKASSVCSFVCEDHYTLLGSAFTTCSYNAWDNNPPTCNYTSCPPIENIEHGRVTCSQGSHLNSKCMFECEPGYRVEGGSLVECVVHKKWSKSPPRCVAGGSSVTCLPPLSFVFQSNVTCTDGNNLGSLCKLACEDFNLRGVLAFRCLNPDSQGRGIWTRTKFTCSGADGRVMDDMLDNELSNLGCDRSFIDVLFVLDATVPASDFNEMQATVTTVTEKLRGIVYPGQTWLGVGAFGATCGAKDVPNFKINIEMSRQNVSEFNNWVRGWSVNGTQCSNFEEALFKSRVYLATHGRRLAIQTLVVFVTSPFDEEALEQVEAALRQGVKIVALAVNNDQAEKVSGNKHLAFSASSFAGLTSQAAQIARTVKSIGCPPVGCSDVSVFKHGKAACRYMKGTGAVCEFSCGDGFSLVGARVIRCLELDGRSATEWTHPVPSCQSRVGGECRQVPAFRDGTVSCSDGNFIGSTCVFRCVPGMFLSGPDTTECEDFGIERGEWSRPFPVCSRDLLCFPPLVAPKDGSLACPDGNHFNTQCQVTCNRGFLAVSSVKIKCNTPLPDGGATWNSIAPRCVACAKEPCEADVLVAVDGSGRLTPDEFRKSLKWGLELVKNHRGEIEQGNTLMGLIQYSGRAVVTCYTGQIKREIKIIMGMGVRDIDVIESRINSYEQMGGCATPAHGLKRGAQYMLAVGRRPVRKFVVLVTHANMLDDVIIEADCVRQNGIEVILVGVGGGLLSKLRAVVGEDGTYASIGSYDDLREVTDAVSSVIRGGTEGVHQVSSFVLPVAFGLLLIQKELFCM